MNDQTPIDAAGGCPVHQPGGVRSQFLRPLEFSPLR